MDKKAMKAYQKAVYGNPNWVDGRINRLKYFCRLLYLNLMFVFAIALCDYVGTIQSVVTGYIFLGIVVCFSLAILWQLVMTYVKRLHDLEWNGWLAVLIVFYPIVNFFGNAVLNLIVSVVVGILSLILLFKRGTKGVNKYGKDPLVKGEE